MLLYKKSELLKNQTIIERRFDLLGKTNCYKSSDVTSSGNKQCLFHTCFQCFKRKEAAFSEEMEAIAQMHEGTEPEGEGLMTLCQMWFKFNANLILLLSCLNPAAASHSLLSKAQTPSPGP